MSDLIKRLEDEVEAAHAAYRNASERHSAAAKALHDARLDATGFKGCIAEFQENWGFGKKAKLRTYRIVVERMRFKDIEGRALVADGSLGVVRKSVLPENAKNLGPYQPPVKP